MFWHRWFPRRDRRPAPPRLAVERLDDRALPSAVVGDYGAAGVWRLSDQNGWKQLTGDNAEQIATADATSIWLDLGVKGLWLYEEGRGFTQTTNANPEAIAVSWDGAVYGDRGRETLYADFGNGGLWRLSRRFGWEQMTSANPEGIGAGAFGVVTVDFGSIGLWQFQDGFGFRQMTSVSPDAVDMTANNVLIADFGALGLYRHDFRGFVQLSGVNVQTFDVSDGTTLVVDTGPGGTFVADVNVGLFQLMTQVNPESVLVASPTRYYLDFGGSSGLVGLNTSIGFQRLGNRDPESVTATLYDFGVPFLPVSLRDLVGPT